MLDIRGLRGESSGASFFAKGLVSDGLRPQIGGMKYSRFLTFTHQLLAMACSIWPAGLAAQEQLAEGLSVIRDFPSHFVSSRDVYIRLPEGYQEGQRYPVLYMHDGQMLFREVDTWNGQTWAAGEVLRTLAREGGAPEVILVGISNLPVERHANYFPEKPFMSLPKNVRDTLYSLKRGEQPLFGRAVNSDAYLKFLVYELKPFIDREYRTLPGQATTFIAGSSMGGLISMYAFFEYPEVFGGAACLSTHWIGSFEQNFEIPAAFLRYLQARRPLLQGRRLYFDHGTTTLDAHYGPHQQDVDRIFGGQPGYLSRKFPGDAHTENAWSRRFHLPARFLLSVE